ncbi:indolepyruvate ferredoxin oxidoreductase [Clostridium acetireducens DSM 10703]|uniref:Indolepyruvate oxidoreductase subunit IorA n=1 Tax=Clostridium acetireducens DSM 10703 TaxID=1121290 RepID=A0A1E8EY70_9CLOT|nr:indolepyruvate ferredoxin oxidoreductase subunit alpha [Clostridium acetireducens]OFI05904.1 indolepyruvate ferredoxin oxidoreductase [Clostridium acetireducens DSM 10703]
MKVIMSGNEAIARGAFEAGCSVASAYPGTPSTEILENFAKYKYVYAQWAPNEKVALEFAAGAAIAGARSLAAMKHVGLNVAADPFFTLAYTGINGGLVIITADDPGFHSSQNEQDNRLYAPHAKVPLIEPSDSQECKDFIKLSYEISEEFDTPVLFRSTTRVSHAKSIVSFEDKKDINVKEYKKNPQKFVMAPANAKKRHYVVEERLEKLREYSNKTPINKIEMGDTKIGIITAGICYQYAKEVLGDNASFLKIGMSYPLPDKKIREFASKVDKIYVVEENEPYIETFVKAMGIKCLGKEVLPICEELNPNIIRKAILGEEIEESYKSDIVPPSRPPVLCPGCPHRGIYYAVSKYKDVIATGDIGCYTLGVAPPLSVTDTVICMGASVSAGLGVEKVNNMVNRKNKVFAFIGDSTFFHSGITGLVNSIYNKIPLVTCILDNRTTGMTGHQDNPGTGRTLQGEETVAVDIKKLVLSLGIKEENVKVINPYNLSETNEAVKMAHDAKDPFVIISKQPCALLKSTVKARKDIKCVINTDKCKKCKACLKTGCPALQYKDGVVSIDKNACNGCGICKQVCKFNAIEKVGE